VCCFADTTWVSDTVSGVWTSAGNPYIVTGNCYVATGESLFIEEGVRIISGGTTDGVIYGDTRLKMQGSAEFPIYDTRVRINRPLKVEYCVIESCHIGLDSPGSVVHTIIKNCYQGIYSPGWNFGPIKSSDINNCEYGIWAYNCGFNAYRTLFHHNNYGVYLDGEWGILDQVFSHCTFESNNYSYRGYRYYYPEPYYDALSHGYFYDCIICDPFIDGGTKYVYNCCYYSSMSPEYFFMPYYAEYHNLDPCFVDTSSCDYRLSPLSPYIDLGIRTPCDTTIGFAPDLGAFESPYSNRVVWFKRLTESINFPAIHFGDTSVLYVRLKNFGNVAPDSVILQINLPFYIDSVSNDEYPPHERTSIYIGFAPTVCASLNDTLYVHYFYESQDSIIKFPVSGGGLLLPAGALAGTLGIDCSPYYTDSNYIPDGETLYIEPGVEIIGSGEPLIIHGTIIALGEADNKITFSGLTSIRFEMATSLNEDTTLFSHCVFDGVKIWGSRAYAKFNNSTIKRTSQAFYFNSNSHIEFDSCSIIDNHSRLSPGGIIVNSVARFNYCLFSRNHIDGVCVYWHSGVCEEWDISSGTTLFGYSDIVLNNCVFKDNTTAWGSALGFWAGYYCRGFYAYSSYVDANNCIFYEENFGYAHYSNCILMKDTRYGGGYTDFTEYSALNCIFLDVGYKSHLFYCLVPPGSSVSDSSSVIFGTATFDSDSSYMLAPTSIGIDMGAEFAVIDSGDTIWAPVTDFYGNPRPSGGGSDIGAAEYQWETYSPSISCGIGWNLVSCPVADTFDITEIFPSALGPAFTYDNSTGAYLDRYSIIPGVGYWALSSDTSSIELSADLLDSVTIEIHRGWNLIGALGVRFNTADLGGWFIPPAYGYDLRSGNYFSSPFFLPGRGYWALSSADTTITIRR
jgi:hypothetical protein